MDVSFTLARRKLDAFDEVLVRHRQAMACAECEDAIEIGLQAWQWIDRAETILLEGEDENILDYSPEVHAELHREYAQWLATTEELLPVAASHAAAGFALPRLPELVKTAATVRDWLATQAAIVAATLPEDELARRAAACNLSAGNYSPTDLLTPDS